jgi:Xaa-Pro aminopeptidase
MHRAGLDALVAYSVGNQPGPVAYLAGYEPRFGLRDVAFFVLVPGERPRHALLAHAYWDNPGDATWVEDVLVMRDPGTRLVEFLPSSIERLGIAGYRFFPAPVYADLRAALPGARIEDATALLMDVAKAKSPRETEEGILEENMVLVLEARLGKPGAGGATITDPVVVTAGGAERLSHLDIRTWPT